MNFILKIAVGLNSFIHPHFHLILKVSLKLIFWIPFAAGITFSSFWDLINDI